MKRKLYLLCISLFAVLSLVGCNRKVKHPSVSTNGEMWVGEVTTNDDAYLLGEDASGKLVFVNPNKAYDLFAKDYEEEIQFIQKEFDLPPINKRNTYEPYKTYGSQSATTDKYMRKKCLDISRFFDIYENSFEDE